MNPRRLKSDRFYTSDYTRAVYTQAGLDWVHENNMKRVVRRHFPALTPALAHAENAFTPWAR